MDAQHNNPPAPAEQFQFQIDSLKERIAVFPEINADNSGEANDLIRLCGNLSKEIDAHRKKEKQPHLDAGRAIDGTFNPLVADAKAAPNALRERLAAHLREQERKAQEEARKAQEEAERARIEAEAEKAVSMPADEDEIEQHAAAKEVQAEAAAAQADKARTAKGSHGLMASGLKTKREVVVTDPVGLVRHFHKHPDVIELCHKLAKAQVRAARGGEVNIEGIAVKEVRTL